MHMAATTSAIGLLSARGPSTWHPSFPKTVWILGLIYPNLSSLLYEAMPPAFVASNNTTSHNTCCYKPLWFSSLLRYGDESLSLKGTSHILTLISLHHRYLYHSCCYRFYTALNAIVYETNVASAVIIRESSLCFG